MQPAAPVIDTYRYLIRLTIAVWCTNYLGPKFRLGSCCLFLGSLVKRVRHRQAPLLGLFILLSFPEAERSYFKTAPLLTSSPATPTPPYNLAVRFLLQEFAADKAKALCRNCFNLTKREFLAVVADF